MSCQAHPQHTSLVELHESAVSALKVRLLRYCGSGRRRCHAAFDPNRSKAASKSRIAASPDLMLVNPLCCHSIPGAGMQFGQLKRREFISLLGGSHPLALRAPLPLLLKAGMLGNG